MKRLRYNPETIVIAAVALLALAVAAAAILAAPPTAASAASRTWVCPPCDPGHDDTVYSQPGTCPVCGMRLVPQEEFVNAAILIFDGVQIIDFAAPYEVFGQGHFRTYTVSATGEPVTTAMGLAVTPKYSFADAPPADVLLVPGGSIDEALADEAIVRWIRATAGDADHVLSVCNGAFLLAEAGLLDGLEATTFYGLLDTFAERYPEVGVVRDRRFVDNGKIVTSAGLSSGIDAAIHVVGKIEGPGEAERVALHLEYDWSADAGFARGALAESRLPDIRLPDGASVRVLGTRGDRDRWESRWAVSTGAGPAEIVAEVRAQLAQQPEWRAADAVPPGLTGVWRSVGEDGVWTAEAVVAPEPLPSGEIEVTLRVRRD